MFYVIFHTNKSIKVLLVTEDNYFVYFNNLFLIIFPILESLLRYMKHTNFITNSLTTRFINRWVMLVWYSELFVNIKEFWNITYNSLSKFLIFYIERSGQHVLEWKHDYNLSELSSPGPLCIVHVFFGSPQSSLLLITSWHLGFMAVAI